MVRRKVTHEWPGQFHTSTALGVYSHYLREMQDRAVEAIGGTLFRETA